MADVFLPTLQIPSLSLLEFMLRGVLGESLSVIFKFPVINLAYKGFQNFAKLEGLVASKFDRLNGNHI